MAKAIKDKLTTPKAKNNRQTTPRVASTAGRVLNDPDSTPEELSLAGSALAQARANKREEDAAREAADNAYALELEKAEKDFVDPHADLKAIMAEHGTMSEYDKQELKKARQAEAENK